jgi:hypothetical protein
LAVATLVVSGAAHAADAPAAALPLAGVRVLVCDSYFDLLHIPALRRLQALGAEVRGGDLSTLTWETASQYNLIITTVEGVPVKPKTGDDPVTVLDKFVKAGGGLLFYQLFYGSESGNQYLAPFGASTYDEVIRDPQHGMKSQLGFGLEYAYTTQVTTGHPVTEGVKTLWYSGGSELIFGTRPIKVSADWKVLAKAEPGATTIIPQVMYAATASKPGTAGDQPPFLAAREYGAGAIVLMGISPLEVFLGQGLPAYSDIAMERGNGLQASDLKKLYDNAITWLAAHATKATGLAQGELKPLTDDWGKGTPLDWTQPDAAFFGGDLATKPARGVIGLHSTLSDGKATPQALIAKAQAVGLQWVSFTERLENFSPEKWASLRKLCKDASTPDFCAMPGLDYSDNSGTRWVVFGDFDWPPPKVFSADGKKIIEPQWWFSINTVPNGPYDIGHAPLRPWDLSMYDMFPVRTTLGGKLVDEAPEGFRYVQGEMDDPFPMAVDMVSDEAGLAAAAGRTCNYVLKDQPGDLATYYRNYMYFGSQFGFISDGPVVTDWRGSNNGRSAGSKWYVPGTEQYRIKLSVHSAVPITDISIYDGPKLFRRFAPNQPQATIFFNVPHDQQRNLTAEITDANGKKAMTGGIFVRDMLNFRFMCGDRGNAICDGVQTDEMGSYLTGPTAPYQRKMTIGGTLAGYGTRHFNVLPPEFDGGMRAVAMTISPYFQIADYTYTPGGSLVEVRNEVGVCSRDGLQQGDVQVGYFKGDTNSWAPKLAPVDVKDVHIAYRSLDFTPRSGDLGVVLVEGTLTVDKPLKLESFNVFGIFHTSQPGEGDHYAISTPEMTVAGITAPQPYSGTWRTAPGSYGMVFPSIWSSTGVMALDDNLTIGTYDKAPNCHIGASLANMPRDLKPGETLTWQYLALHGRPGENANTADWDNLAKTMGLRGDPAYKVTDVKVGQVQSTQFLLELTPADGGFLGTVGAADLPLRLPVRVAGMNGNWTFGWFDLDRKEWFPSAWDYHIGEGFFTLDTRVGAHRFFAGHPVVAGDPNLKIAAFTDAKTQFTAEVNNVGTAPVTTTVRLNPALGDAAPQEVTLAPGEMKSLTFAWTPK